MAAPNGLVVAWPSTAASIPSGWSRYATLDSKVPKASTSEGSTGGADTHTHSGTAHTHSDTHYHEWYPAHTVDVGWASGGSQTVLEVTTAHTVSTQNSTGLTTSSSGSGTSSSGTSIGFARYSVIWIQSNGTTDIPTGAVAWCDQTTIPSGWAFCDGTASTPDLRSKFLRGAATGADGGTDTTAASHNHTLSHQHTHDTTSHTHTLNSPTTTVNGAGNSVASGAPSLASTHNHTVSGSVTSASHSASNLNADNATAASQTPEPAHYTMSHIQATTQALAPKGVIALYTSSVAPTGWALCNGGNGTPNLNGNSYYIKGKSTSGSAGSTGGSNTHTHSGSHTHGSDASSGTHDSASITLSAPSSTINYVGGVDGTAVSGSHTHTGMGASSGRFGQSGSGDISYQSVNHEPAYVTMVFIMALDSGGAEGELSWEAVNRRWRQPRRREYIDDGTPMALSQDRIVALADMGLVAILRQELFASRRRWGDLDMGHIIPIVDPPAPDPRRLMGMSVF